MPDIFGLDIQSMVADAIDAAGGLPAGTLIKSAGAARDPDNPSRRAAPAETRHALQAVVEAKQVRREGTAVAETRLVMTIIGGSIVPLAKPAVNDRIELAGITYTLTELVSADPAEATFAFAVS